MIVSKLTIISSQSLQDKETALHIAVREASLSVEDVLKKSGQKRLELIKNKVDSHPLAYITVMLK